MELKKFFYILVVLLSNFIFSIKMCDPLKIIPDEYDFTQLNEYQKTFSIIVGNKIITAFDFDYIEDFFSIIRSTIFGLYKKAEMNENKKYKSYFSDLLIFPIIWNNYYDNEIENIRYESSKYVGLYNKIIELIYDCKWIGNNVILTAITAEEKCSNFDAAFYHIDSYTFEKRKYDKYYYNKGIKRMAKLTCILRKNECNDQDECFKNLMRYAECKEKERKDKYEVCPEFTEKCELQKLYKNKI